MSIIKRLILSKSLIDVSLFGVSIGVLTYLGENHYWAAFTCVVFVCLLLFIGLHYLESKPFLERLKRLEEREYEAAHKMIKYGISDFFNMKDNKEMHKRNIVNIEIIEKGNRFSLLGESGTSYLDPSVRRHWDFLKTKLDQGVPLRLLIVNPFCESKKLRNDLNGVTAQVDPKIKLEIICNLSKKYANVEVRFTNEIYCSVFFSENEMMYDPYHLGKLTDRLENYFLAFYLKKTSLNSDEFSYYNMLKNHFEVLWDRGMHLDQFLDEYQQYFNHIISTDQS